MLPAPSKMLQQRVAGELVPVVAAVEDFAQAALRRVPGADEEVEVVLYGCP
jgi:hypothetical protein